MPVDTVAPESTPSTPTVFQESEPTPDFVLFTVAAYRWGWLNGHQYMVGVETDLERAIQRADEEASNRGGKYGVTVMGWESPLIGCDESGEFKQQTCRRLHHASSTCGEDEPYENARLEMFYKLGHTVHEVATSGQMRLPKDVDPHTLGTPAPADRAPSSAVVIPAYPWLRHAVRHAESESRLMDAVREKICSDRAAGVVPRMRPAGQAVSEEDRAWMDQICLNIDKELAGLFERADQFLAQLGDPSVAPAAGQGAGDGAGSGLGGGGGGVDGGGN